MMYTKQALFFCKCPIIILNLGYYNNLIKKNNKKNPITVT